MKESIDFNSIEDYPHKIKCEGCGKMFWTSSSINYGMCSKCDPRWSSEITYSLAKKIRRLIDINLGEELEY